jgi:hypothetical protein
MTSDCISSSSLSGSVITPVIRYVQLISHPGPQGDDMERKQATRALFDTCVPWTAWSAPELEPHLATRALRDCL